MVGDGCLFTEAEYKRFLPETSISLLHKVSLRLHSLPYLTERVRAQIRMEKEVDLAGFEDLAKCPFCPYACVIENAQERLFRCMRVGCEVVSCRECKKVDHLPKSCLEVSEDRIIDNRHTVEEAMTAALMRACPKCSNPYVKESGCNKMSCVRRFLFLSRFKVDSVCVAELSNALLLRLWKDRHGIRTFYQRRSVLPPRSHRIF